MQSWSSAPHKPGMVTCNMWEQNTGCFKVQDHPQLYGEIEITLNWRFWSFKKSYRNKTEQKTKSCLLGIAIHSFSHSIWKPSLVCLVSSRTARTTHRDLVSKRKNKQINKMANSVWFLNFLILALTGHFASVALISPSSWHLCIYLTSHIASLLLPSPEIHITLCSQLLADSPTRQSLISRHVHSILIALEVKATLDL